MLLDANVAFTDAMMFRLVPAVIVHEATSSTVASRCRELVDATSF
jgi:hypothetical protein